MTMENNRLEELYNLYNNTNYGCWACGKIANPYKGWGPNEEKCLTQCAVYKIYIQLLEYKKRDKGDGR